MPNWIRILLTLLDGRVRLDDGHGLPPPPR